ncbi:hypothetical protein [Endozoicomonas arenosclerae]|uniref:hypothetical protein n=1 Tax=Endozoicomonas arenosclerae TaxID=1633495 RepID=UPI0007840211|nr:hypothetical protein [Endozoicomonas arenosclerae]
MKKLLTGSIFILAILGLGFTVANEMDLFDEQNDTDSGQYDYDSEDLYQNETASYPGQYSESEEEEEDEDEDDDDDYEDDSDEDDSIIEQGS